MRSDSSVRGSWKFIHLNRRGHSNFWCRHQNRLTRVVLRTFGHHRVSLISSFSLWVTIGGKRSIGRLIQNNLGGRGPVQGKPGLQPWVSHEHADNTKDERLQGFIWSGFAYFVLEGQKFISVDRERERTQQPRHTTTPTNRNPQIENPRSSPVLNPT